MIQRPPTSRRRNTLTHQQLAPFTPDFSWNSCFRSFCVEIQALIVNSRRTTSTCHNQSRSKAILGDLDMTEDIVGSISQLIEPAKRGDKLAVNALFEKLHARYVEFPMNSGRSIKSVPDLRGGILMAKKAKHVRRRFSHEKCGPRMSSFFRF